MKKILVVDVDETVVKLRDVWADWMYLVYKNRPDFSKDINDPVLLEFWKREDLYDNLKPISGVVDYINDLSKKYQVVFISHCFEEHWKSKLRFLERNFEFDGFLKAYEGMKFYTDYVIEDRIYLFKKIKKVNPNAICLQLDTVFQGSSKDIDYRFDWNEIFNFLMKEE